MAAIINARKRSCTSYRYPFASYGTEGHSSSSCKLCPSFSKVFRFFEYPSSGFAPLLLVVLIVAYLPFSSPLFLPRRCLAQGCTAVYCDSTMRDLPRHGLRNISRFRKGGPNYRLFHSSFGTRLFYYPRVIPLSPSDSNRLNRY